MINLVVLLLVFSFVFAKFVLSKSNLRACEMCMWEKEEVRVSGSWKLGGSFMVTARG